MIIQILVAILFAYTCKQLAERPVQLERLSWSDCQTLECLSWRVCQTLPETQTLKVGPVFFPSKSNHRFFMANASESVVRMVHSEKGQIGVDVALGVRVARVFGSVAVVWGAAGRVGASRGRWRDWVGGWVGVQDCVQQREARRGRCGGCTQRREGCVGAAQNSSRTSGNHLLFKTAASPLQFWNSRRKTIYFGGNHLLRPLQNRRQPRHHGEWRGRQPGPPGAATSANDC